MVSAQRREALLKEYGEVSSNFRTLTDIRFRLLGFLPIASAATAALGARTKDGLDQGIPVPLALFGLAAAIGIVTYNSRNDQLYNELVGRAAAIERSIGVPDGAFANRPRAWLHLRLGPWKWPVNHSQGVTTIFAATVAFWLYLTIDAAVHTAYPCTKSALLPALLGTALVSAIVWWIIRRQRRARDRELREGVRAAITLLAAFDNDLARVRDNKEFLRACAAALGGSTTTVTARSAFYGDLTPEALSYYAMGATGLNKTASLISLLTDLPQRWVFDMALNRQETTLPNNQRQLFPAALRDMTLAAGRK